MTITVTALGTRTAQVTTSGVTATFEELTTAVANAITGVNPVATTGWSLYDSFSACNVNKLAGLDFSQGAMCYTQVFRCLNKDGLTYKYIMLRWDRVNMMINTSTCEAWNATTHVATNEAWTFNDCSGVGFRLDATDIIVMVSPRWCLIHAYINNEPCQWSGVVEMAREDVLDTAAAGNPCFGWIGSSLNCLGSNSTPNTATMRGLANGQPLISVPRTKTGETGYAAAKSWAADYGAATYPQWDSATTSGFMYRIGNATARFIASAWDATKAQVMPIKPIYNYMGPLVTNYGAIFGLKTMSPRGVNMNKVRLPIDADGNASASGTISDHWLLNNQHKDLGAAASLLSNTSLTSTVMAVNASQPSYMESTGAAYYTLSWSGSIGGNAKLSKINAITGAWISDILTATAFFDLKFDGESYIYIGTTTGLRRLDIKTDTLSNELSIAGGVMCMAITGKHVVTFPNTAGTGHTVTRVKRSDFTVDTSVPITTSGFTASTVIRDATSDFDGNVFGVSMQTGVTASDGRLVKITPAGLVSYLAFGHSAGNTIANCAIHILDPTTAIATDSHISSTAYHMVFSTDMFAALDSTSNGSTSITTANSQRASIVKIAGNIGALDRPYNVTAATLRSYSVNATTGRLGNGINAGADMQAALSGSTSTSPFLYWDGARLFTSTSGGLKAISGINGITASTGVTLGQMVIPA